MTASAGHREPRPVTAAVKRAFGPAGRSDLILWMLITFLVLEYARPPLIAQLKLQMIISIVLPIACYTMIKDKRWSWTLTFQLGLIAVSASGIIYATNNYAAYFTTRVLYTTIAISISMAWLLSRFDYFRRAMWAWTLIMGYLGFFGVIHGGFGPGGIIGDENELALACVTGVPIAYYGAIYSKGARRWVYLGIGVLLMAAIVISNSRGGFIGLVAIVGYVILISKHRIRSIAGIAIVAAVFFLAVPRSYRNEILSIQQEATGEVEDGTGDMRLFLWTAAFNMWKAHPILGVGAGNSRFHTGRFQPDWEGSIYRERDWSGTAIHSGVFELLSETGSAGVFFYGGFIVNHFAVLRRARRIARETRGLPTALRNEVEMYAGGLAGGMIGYISSGLFLSVAYHPYAFYFSALSLSLAWGFELELKRISAAGSAKLPASGEPPDTRAGDGSGPRSKSTASLGRELLAGAR